MKKAVLLALTLTVVLCACNRKKFINKLTGTWTISKYILHSGQNSTDMTASFDTTNHAYKLVINEDNVYTTSWTSYFYKADSLIIKDSIGVDTLTGLGIFKYDTARFVDTTITPYAGGGKWYLLNSEEDLELIDNADTGNAQILRILSLGKSNLNLLNGAQEYDLKK